MYIDQESHYTMTRASNGIWYYYAYNEYGRRCRRSTGRKNRKEAEAEVHRRISQGKLLEMPDTQRMNRTTFAEFAAPFFVWGECPIVQGRIARGGHYSYDLCVSNRHSLEKHILPYFGSRILGDITRKDIDGWILALPEEHGISAATANKMLSLMRQIMDAAVFDGYIPVSPARDVKPLIEKPERRGAFTVEEIERLFSVSWSSEMAYTACFISAFTGMRMGEIRALRVSRIHETGILVDSSWSDGAGLKCTKSGRSRMVPITKRMHTLLSALMKGRKDDELVFSLDGNTPCEDRRFSGPLKEAMEKAGIVPGERKLTFHSFRHFMNTQVVAAGVSGEIVRNVIGHESEKMTDHYLHLEDSELGAIRSVQIDLTRGIRRHTI